MEGSLNVRLRHSVEKLIQAYLVFLIFGQRNKTSSVLCNLTDPKLKTTF